MPFDALEFGEDLATIDVAYGLPFLIMDLDCRLDQAAATRMPNRYVDRGGAGGLVGGFVPFLSLRAMVRAHVEARRRPVSRRRSPSCARRPEWSVG